MYNAKGKLKQKDLIEEHLPLVKREALYVKMRLPDSIELDDLVQYGMFGLLDAAKRYDPVQGVRFEAYAKIRIRGAIFDELRAADWIPRAVRQQTRDIDRAMRDLSLALNREPEDHEVAEKLGIDLDRYYKLLSNTNSTNLMSMDEVGLEHVERNTSNHHSSPLDELLEAKEKGFLADAIRLLPEREQQVLALYYTEEMNMKEIGLILGVSESRVCQLHSSAIIRMRKNLQKEEQ